MERLPTDAEQINAAISQTENGVDVCAQRQNVWHFANEEEARSYFRRRHKQYNALRWAMRALVVAGVAEVARGVDQTVRSHDFLTGAGAVAVSGLVLIVQGLNQSAVGERVRLHREVVRRLRRQGGEGNNNT